MGTCMTKDKYINVSLDLPKLILIPEITEGKVIKVYDGDTIWVAAEHQGKMYKFNIRVYGVDCPEMKGGTEETRAQAEKAKEFTINRIFNHIVNIEIMTGKVIDGKEIKDPYGRLIAKVFIDGRDLANELIVYGHGIKCFGSRKNAKKIHDAEMEMKN